jgi:hypothetical protein
MDAQKKFDQNILINWEKNSEKEIVGNSEFAFNKMLLLFIVIKVVVV